LLGALGIVFFFKKIRKTAFADGLARGARKKNKKIKTPLFADGPASRPSAKKGSKTVNLTPSLTATFLADGPLWALSTGCAESLELECSTKNRGREKISVGPVPRATLGKAWISSSVTRGLEVGASKSLHNLLHGALPMNSLYRPYNFVQHIL
jgi:hypothetical protein